MIKNTDERVKLRPERLKYWMSRRRQAVGERGDAAEEVHGQVRAAGDRGRGPVSRRADEEPAAPTA